jgi:drug/metabolite transporter (DMT)-like permease
MLAVAAVGLAGFNAFLIAAVRETDAASVGAVVGCVPVALALLGPLLESRPLRPRVIAAAALVAVGAGVVQWSGARPSLLALALALGALACEAAFSLVAVPLIASVGPAIVATYACLFATPLLLGASVVVDGRGALPIPTGEEAAALVYLAVMVTAIGFALWYASIEGLGVDRAGLFAGVMPVSALLTAAAIGASELTSVRLLGTIAVGAGVSAGVTAAGRGAVTG